MTTNVSSTISGKVSVLMPVRNAERDIGAALRSILWERSHDLEVVVIDDRSTDNSVEIANGLGDSRVRVVGGAGQGISAALNVGLEHATGALVMRCDADDLYPPGRIARQIDWLAANPDFGALCGNFSTMTSAGAEITVMPTGDLAEEITPELLRGETRTHLGTFAIATLIARQLGGFRTFFETAEDLDFQLRLSNVTRVMYLPEVWYRYRLHNHSITHSQGRERRLFFERTARSLQAQRREGGLDDLDLGRPPSYIPETGADDRPDSAESMTVGFLWAAAWTSHAKGRRLNAAVFAVRALRHDWMRVAAWKSFAALLIRRPQLPQDS